MNSLSISRNEPPPKVANTSNTNGDSIVFPLRPSHGSPPFYPTVSAIGLRRSRWFGLFAVFDRHLLFNQGLDRQQPWIAKDDLIVVISVSAIGDDQRQKTARCRPIQC